MAIINTIYFLCLPQSPRQLYGNLSRLVGFNSDRGFLSKVLIDREGVSHRYMIFVPLAMKADDRLPLVVYLNGKGENGADGISPLKNGLAPAIWERSSDFPFVVVWPQCIDGESWNANGKSASLALAIMREVAEGYHTDSDRVYLTGISAGGTGVWSIAAKYPELFAAIVPISASGMQDEDIDKIAEAELPVWMYSVAQDGPNVVESNRNAHQRLLRSGLSSRHTELEVGTGTRNDAHDAWSFAFHNSVLYSWLRDQRRSTNHSKHANFELLDPMAVPVKVGVVAQTRFPDAAPNQVAKAPNDFRSSEATMSRISTRDVSEMHLEFRTDSEIKHFAIGFFRERSSSAALYLLSDEFNCRGIYSWPQLNSIQSASPGIEEALRPDRWNDLRLRFLSSGISAELNGWHLFEPIVPGLSFQDAIIGFIAHGKGGTCVELRNVRIQRKDQPNSVSEKLEEADTLRDESQQRHIEESVGGNHAVDVASIVKAWQAREQLLSNVEVTWSFDASKHFATWPSRTSGLNVAPGSDIPTATLKMTPTVVHYESAWTAPKVSLSRKTGFSGEPNDQEYTFAFRAKSIATNHTSNPLRFEAHCDAQRRIDLISGIRTANRAFVFSRPDPWQERGATSLDAAWQGALLAFRPLARQGISVQPGTCKVRPEIGWADSVRCRVLEETTHSGKTTFVRRFWVDPLRDFLPLKMSFAINGSIREYVNLHYTRKDGQPWLPVSWTVVTKPVFGSSHSYPGSEALFEAAIARIKQCKINDHLVSASPALEFKYGTVVYEQATNKLSEVIAHGQRRTLTTAEAMAFAMGDHVGAPGSTVPTWVIAGGIVALLVGWIVVRRYRRVS